MSWGNIDTLNKITIESEKAKNCVAEKDRDRIITKILVELKVLHNRPTAIYEFVGKWR